MMGKQVAGVVKVNGYNYGNNPHKLGYGAPICPYNIL